jgi:hypothetical protein
LGELERRGLDTLDELLGPGRSPVEVPLLATEPNDLTSLRALAADLSTRLG